MPKTLKIEGLTGDFHGFMASERYLNHAKDIDKAMPKTLEIEDPTSGCKGFVALERYLSHAQDIGN